MEHNEKEAVCRLHGTGEYLTGTNRNSSAFVGGRKFERIRV